jgi:hypothetical protein
MEKVKLVVLPFDKCMQWKSELGALVSARG